MPLCLTVHYNACAGLCVWQGDVMAGATFTLEGCMRTRNVHALMMCCTCIREVRETCLC